MDTSSQTVTTAFSQVQIPNKIWCNLTLGSVDEDLLKIPQRSFIDRVVAFELSADKENYIMQCYFDTNSLDFLKNFELNHNIRSYIAIYIPKTRFNTIQFIDNTILHTKDTESSTDSSVTKHASFTLNFAKESELQQITITYKFIEMKHKKYLSSITYQVPYHTMYNKYCDFMDICRLCDTTKK